MILYLDNKIESSVNLTHVNALNPDHHFSVDLLND